MIRRFANKYFFLHLNTFFVIHLYTILTKITAFFVHILVQKKLRNKFKPKKIL
jgi:hypothetical protein